MSRISRRELLGTIAGGAALTPLANLASAPAPQSVASASPPQTGASPPQRVPLKIAHRASNMGMLGNFDVFKFARQIPGLLGVELQVAQGKPNLRDFDAVRRYKQEADRWGMMIPSVAGVWDRGVNFTSPGARANLRQSILAAKLLGARGILVPAFNENCPDMRKESSYGPVVEVLSDVAPEAADAGAVLMLELSLNSEDSRKLVDLVNHPSVRINYDVYNGVLYHHPEDMISGIKTLGKSRIFHVHVKNNHHLLGESAGLDWKAALQALSEIEYDGWFVFETHHAGLAEVIEDTAKNIAFMEQYCRMPLAYSADERAPA